jgi:uncharacterized protein (TIGR00255 family)
MPHSMTGFAAVKGQGHGYSWVWDLRSVNGKGLDLRFRVPDWLDGLEAAVRAILSPALTRGNVSVTLKLTRDEAGAPPFRLNAPALQAALNAIGAVQSAAKAARVNLADATAAELLLLRGVTDTGIGEEDTRPLRAALLADLAPLLAAFQATRATEGAAILRILSGQLDLIESLTGDAASLADERAAASRDRLLEALARVLGATEVAVDETRLAQELALIAVKADVTEELDRLSAHVAAARGLLAEPGAMGRKFDFLVQEFMREANTLCSKAQSMAITRIGLDLKTVIDQMREQVQNVE